MAGIVGFDHNLRRSQPHRLDQGGAIADCGAKSLRLGQRRELLAGVIAGVRPRAVTKWAAFFRENSTWVARGFNVQGLPYWAVFSGRSSKAAARSACATMAAR